MVIFCHKLKFSIQHNKRSRLGPMVLVLEGDTVETKFPTCLLNPVEGEFVAPKNLKTK